MGLGQMEAIEVETEGSADRMARVEAEPWADTRFFVEGLEGASCSAHAKTMAIEAIAVSAEGGTAEDWRKSVATRHADHPQWAEHLREAERCMRAAGLWPWVREEARTTGHGTPAG